MQSEMFSYLRLRAVYAKYFNTVSNKSQQEKRIKRIHRRGRGGRREKFSHELTRISGQELATKRHKEKLDADCAGKLDTDLFCI